MELSAASFVAFVEGIFYHQKPEVPIFNISNNGIFPYINTGSFNFTCCILPLCVAFCLFYRITFLGE